MVTIGSEAKRKLKSYHLSRYACLLISMSLSSRKENALPALEYFSGKQNLSSSSLQNADTYTNTDIVFFSDSEGKLRVELVFDGDTVWTTQKRIAEIFQVDVRTVSYHINEILNSGELNKYSVGVEGLAQQHHALGGLDEGVCVMDVGTDMRVNADEFQLVGPCEDVLEHGQCRPSARLPSRRRALVLFGDLLVAQVVRVLHVVVQFALGLRVPVTGITIAFGDVRVRNSRRHACWISREFVQYAECRGIGAGRSSGTPNF